jgi:hypothetical protein
MLVDEAEWPAMVAGACRMGTSDKTSTITEELTMNRINFVTLSAAVLLANTAAMQAVDPKKNKDTQKSDWILVLPEQARSRYSAMLSSLRGDERVSAVRSWMTQWKKYLRDPNLGFCELDYVKLNIDNRLPSLYITPIGSQRQGWIQDFKKRKTLLDSMENELRAIRARDVRDPELLTAIGKLTDAIAEERRSLDNILTTLGTRY